MKGVPAEAMRRRRRWHGSWRRRGWRRRRSGAIWFTAWGRLGPDGGEAAVGARARQKSVVGATARRKSVVGAWGAAVTETDRTCAAEGGPQKHPDGEETHEQLVHYRSRD